MITWFLVMLIFHPKPQGGASQCMPNPSNDFLSGGKQLEGYPGSPPMMTQESQASSDYLQYTKSVGASINNTYKSSATYQLEPLPPPPPENMLHNSSVVSSTPSAVTLVSSSNYQSRNSRSKGMNMDPTESMIDDTTHLPPYRPVSAANNHSHHIGSILPPPPPSSHQPGADNDPSQCLNCHQCRRQQQQTPHSAGHTTTTTATRTVEESAMHTTIQVDTAQRYSNESLSLSDRDATLNSITLSHTSEERHLVGNTNESSNNTGNHQQRNPNWQLSLDFSEKATNGNVKRENSEDSLWLHQSPKGVSGAS
jgi:hypothetical protein